MVALPFPEPAVGKYPSSCPESINGEHNPEQRSKEPHGYPPSADSSEQFPILDLHSEYTPSAGYFVSEASIIRDESDACRERRKTKKQGEQSKNFRHLSLSARFAGSGAPSLPPAALPPHTV